MATFLRTCRRRASAVVAVAAVLIIYYVFFGHSVKNTPTITASAFEWDGVEAGITFREILPKTFSLTILLLHGHAFTSHTWQDLGTLEYFGSRGYRVVAVDLPGYGQSTKIETPRTLPERGQFIRGCIEKLQLDRPVLVSPSVSGTFSLPFVLTADNARLLRAFIPVAPVATEKFDVVAFETLDLPTLIVYGEQDLTVGISSLERLKRIPGSAIHAMKGAGHASYVSNRDEFHSTLESFLQKLKLGIKAMVQERSEPNSPEEITFDDLCEVIPELKMFSDSAATPQVVPGANRVPSPDLSYHYGTSLDYARTHKSEPNLRIKLEQEAAQNQCTFTDQPSMMSDYLRYSMQVHDTTRHPILYPFLHPDKDFSLAPNVRTPQRQTLPPLPRLVKLEPTTDQQLLHQTQSVCQLNGIGVNDIKREFPLLSDQLEGAKYHGFSGTYGPHFPILCDSEPWFSNTAIELEQDSKMVGAPMEIYDDIFRDEAALVDQHKGPTVKMDDRDSGLGEELDAYTKNSIRKDLIWNDKSALSPQDVTKRPKLASDGSTTAKWEIHMRKVGHRTTFKSGRPRLCQFLLELLEDPDKYSYMIEWLDQERGVFKFIQSGEVARMWGRRRNKPQMKYENFARSLRTYIAKGILTKPRSKLVYRFAKVKN